MMREIMDFRLNQFKDRMEHSVDAFLKEISGIRAGRASTALLDPIKVEAYGSLMPLTQVGTVSAPDARMLVVNVWDKGLVKSVEKAIRESSANLNPATDGQTVRVPIPPLSEERRQELSKLAGKYAEDAKVAIRNIRRDAMDTIKKQEKDGKISEDDLKRLSDDIQNLTNEYVKKIDTIAEAKQKDIMQI